MCSLPWVVMLISVIMLVLFVWLGGLMDSDLHQQYWTLH